MNDIISHNNSQFGSIRTLTIDDTPWFVGKDVATALGYGRPTKAIQDHVDKEDKDVIPIQDSIGRNQNTPIINESGLYSLIFSSTLPSAKQFKHWVTSEVLPSIRKTGGYTTSAAVPNMIVALENKMDERMDVFEQRILEKFFDLEISQNVLTGSLNKKPLTLDECMQDAEVDDIRSYCIDLAKQIEQLGSYDPDSKITPYRRIYNNIHLHHNIDIYELTHHYNHLHNTNYSPFAVILKNNTLRSLYINTAKEMIENLTKTFSMSSITTINEAINAIQHLTLEEFNSNTLCVYKKIYKFMTQFYNINWSHYDSKTPKLELIKNDDVLQQAFISCVNDLYNN